MQGLEARHLRLLDSATSPSLMPRVAPNGKELQQEPQLVLLDDPAPSHRSGNAHVE